MVFQDNAVVTFDDMKKLQDFIGDVEKTVKLKNVTVSNLKVVRSKEINALTRLGFEDLEIYTDTVENSKITAFYENELFHIGVSAIPTLQDRCGCAGSFFSVSRLKKPEWYVETINKAAKITKRDAVMYMESGKVRSFWSAGYKYIPISEILLCLNKKMTEWRYKSGWWNHEFTVCEFVNADPKLTDPYRTFFPESESLSAYIAVSTSNTTANGVNINFGLDNGFHIPLNVRSEFSLKHIGDASIEKFQNNLEKCFSLFNKKANDIFNKMNFPISYPTSCLKEIFKKINGIPLNIKAETIRYFHDTKPQGRCTGIDIYFAICNASRIAKENGFKKTNLMLIEEACARAALLDFHSFDLPDRE